MLREVNLGRRHKQIKDPIEYVSDWQLRSRFPDQEILLLKVNFSPSYINTVEDILIGVIDSKAKMVRKLSGFIKETKEKGLSNRDIAPILGISHMDVSRKSKDNVPENG